MGLIYFAVILGASIIGAITGLGGGLIIRPVFDSISYHSVLNIGFFASTSVLTMAVVSTIRKLRDGSVIDWALVLPTGIGAMTGGVIGNLLLEHLIYALPEPRNAQQVQVVAAVTVISFAIYVSLRNNKRLYLPNKWWCMPVGVCLGIIASFLGMGGGPINVPFFMIFWGMGIKDATTYSIAIIFFSHLARLITLGFTVGYSYFDLPILLFVIPAAVTGGLLGTRFSKVLPPHAVKRMFIVALLGVICLNLFNLFFVI